MIRFMLTYANHTQPRRREVMLFTLKIVSGKSKLCILLIIPSIVVT